LWTLLFALLVSVLIMLGTGGLTESVTEKQTRFVADNVRRSAVQCYAVEGRFPPTQGGLAYLKGNYGLAIDERRYAVFYESLGDNLIPRIEVIPVASQSPVDAIARLFGFSGEGG
jgi:hypothetical protein